MSLAQQARETLQIPSAAQPRVLNTYLDLAQRLRPWSATGEFWTYWQQVNARCLQLGQAQLRAWLTVQSLWTHSWLASLQSWTAVPALAKHEAEHPQPLLQAGLHALDPTGRDAAPVQERGVQEGRAALDPTRDLGKQIAEAAYLKAQDQGRVPSLAQEAQAALDQTRDLQMRIAERAYLKAQARGFVPGHEHQDWAEAEREVRTRT